jgi:flavorubredoxin
MARLLIVHHTPSPAVHALLEAARSGASDPAIGPIEVVVRAALATTVSDVLEADGYLLGTPANLGSMSGALKHFFDTVYYPCLEDTQRRPYSLFVHGNDDTTGAIRDIERIVAGLRWNRVQPVLSVTGSPTIDDLEAARELGAATSAILAEGMA